MFWKSGLLAAALLHLPTHSSAAQEQPPPPASTVNDTARLLAGLPVADESPLAPLASEVPWFHHARIFGRSWDALEKRQLSKARVWAKANIPITGDTKGTVFYMFSGPDFLYADAFFPHASTYILCGLEPTGPFPDLAKLDQRSVGGELRTLRASLDSVLSFSFFLTKEMKQDLNRRTLGGTLPIIYLFLARTGKTLTSAVPVGIAADGTLAPRSEGERLAPNEVPGVKITFTAPGSNQTRTLYYFSTDVSNSGLKPTGFLKFCASHAPGASCVKSASYLMHKSYFSTIRGFLLDHSRLLVQDDSGIPCSHFKPDHWTLRFHGKYLDPIPLFKEYRQPLLAEYYRTTKPAPMDFGIGYRHRVGESMLMIANRKSPET